MKRQYVEDFISDKENKTNRQVQEIGGSHQRTALRNQAREVENVFHQYREEAKNYLEEHQNTADMGEMDYERFCNKCLVMWEQQTSLQKFLRICKMEILNKD